MRNPQRPIALIGLSGVGKSSVARLLAARLGWLWSDTDSLIVQRAGRSIAEMFAQEGEEAFRALETLVLQDALRRSFTNPHVIATGGGIVTREENRSLLRMSTYIVWIDAPTDILIERLRAHDEPRPLLAGSNPAERLEQLRDTRHPLYASLAEYTVNTAALSVAEVAENVLTSYMQRFTASDVV
jgi:shikimate kinase